MAWVTPTNVATGDVLTASKWNQDVVENTVSLPRGVMGYASVTSNQTGITTVTDVTGLTVTFTAISSRYYRTTLYVPNSIQTGSAGYAILTITDGSNNQKQQATFYKSLTGNGESFIVVSFVETGISGSTTRKARATTSPGTLQVSASATAPAFIIVEDIGAA